MEIKITGNNFDLVLSDYDSPYVTVSLTHAPEGDIEGKTSVFEHSDLQKALDALKPEVK